MAPESPLTAPRLRLHFPPGRRSLDLAQARLMLFATLWARSLGGTVCASGDNGAVMDDLTWLGLEPDEVVATPKEGRYTAVADELVGRALAYPCFCGTTEFREMAPIPSGQPESHRYDGRCRGLTEDDRKALRKGGRAVAVRLAQNGAVGAFTTRDGRTFTVSPDFDFCLIRGDSSVLPPFAALVDDHTAGATVTLIEERAATDAPYRSLIAAALGWSQPEIALLPEWTAPASTQSVRELRAAGFHPRTLLRALAATGWDPGEATTVAAMVARFQLGEVRSSSADLDLNALREINGALLASLPEAERVAAVVDHLTRHGFPLADRDPRWQARFVAACLPDLRTVADAQALASLLVISTVDYDKEAVRILRAPATQSLLLAFERTLDSLTTDEEAEWIEAVARFRQQADSPGRALGTLRLALTGTREGPNLAALLSLLGRERCRSRLDKARRYAAS
jgi:nondiscriminating glutamyl-tRNA synthetase